MYSYQRRLCTLRAACERVKKGAAHMSEIYIYKKHKQVMSNLAMTLNNPLPCSPNIASIHRCYMHRQGITS